MPIHLQESQHGQRKQQPEERQKEQEAKEGQEAGIEVGQQEVIGCQPSGRFAVAARPSPETAGNLQRRRCELRSNLQLESTPGTSSTLQDRRDLATVALRVAASRALCWLAWQI
jgi:hypothetical protein